MPTASIARRVIALSDKWSTAAVTATAMAKRHLGTVSRCPMGGAGLLVGLWRGSILLVSTNNDRSLILLKLCDAAVSYLGGNVFDL